MGRFLVTMCLVVACSTSSKPELDLDAKGVEAMRHLATIYATHANDCEKLAAALVDFGM